MIRFHNTLTRHVEPFEPIVPGEVRMYHCGPTVYKRPHIGNYRAYVFADLLRRTFEFFGFRVTQVMNITDVGHLTGDDAADAGGEDKLEKAARDRKLDPWAIAREIEAQFHEDLKGLGCLPAHHYPRATDHIAEMIVLIGRLIEKKHAYVVGGNVYFAVDSFPRYGALSGNTLGKLSAGASGRVEDREDKRNPHDFALWKHDPKHLMQWDSPWGRGFPGWHIECSAMAMKYLGPTFDIHTGGPDNKFPHHECEIAQSECANGVPFVRTWLHNGWLEIGGEKMSKSRGALLTLPDMLARGYAGADVRFLLLRQHYRAPLPFSLELMDEAKASRGKFDNFVSREMADRPPLPANPIVAEAIRTAEGAFSAALEDDLNTAAAFAAIHDMMRAVNRAVPGASDAAAAIAAMRDFDRVLGILSPAEEKGLLDADVDALIRDREEARKRKDFAAADRIRKELLEKGIVLEDTAGGVRWKRK
ncbi:MAG: cysteine--tRNA ligase [Planctomycetota bacterium]